MMKKTLALLSVLILVTVPASYGVKSLGPTFGNLSTADVCGFGQGYLGGFAGFGDEATAVFGAFKYGFSPETDGRIRLGFSDLDARGSDLELAFSLDFKYELMDYYEQTKPAPFDLAIGGLFEFTNYEGFGLWEFGGFAIASIPYRFENGRRLIPYGRINLRVEQVSPDAGNSDSDFRVGLNPGVKFEFNQDMSLYGEFQIDGNAAFYTGLEFRAF